MSEDEERNDGVDLMGFSPRIEAAPPDDFGRDEMMSGPASASVSEETRYYRIGEVSRLTALKPFVLRYWETEFPSVGPKKSDTGHRMYRRKEVEKLLKIKYLLYEKKFTIEGARQYLLGEAKMGKRKRPVKVAQRELFAGDPLPEIRKELAAILELLR